MESETEAAAISSSSDSAKEACESANSLCNLLVVEMDGVGGIY